MHFVELKLNLNYFNFRIRKNTADTPSTVDISYAPPAGAVNSTSADSSGLLNAKPSIQVLTFVWILIFMAFF